MEIRALHDSEFDEHADLVYVSYSHERDLKPGEMLAHRDWWLRSIERDPYYEPAQTRVMSLDGRLVASVTCFYRPTWVRGRRVEAGCIGSVCTHPDHRRRGHVRAILAEATDWMRAQGWEWSFLYGLEAIYGGSGWRNLTAFELVADVTPRDDLPMQAERLADIDDDADVGLLASLYDEFCAPLVGATIRTEDYWRRRVLSSTPWGPAPEYRIVEAADGALLGYYCMSGAAAREIAWSGRPHEVLAMVFARAGGRPVSFPLTHPELVQALRELTAIPTQARCFEGAGAITLCESYKGLWRHHGIDDPVVSELHDSADLVRMLHDSDYVMWPADRA